MLQSIDHVGIAVPDLEEAKRFYTEVLGLAICGLEAVPSQKVVIAFLPVGEVNVELVTPTSADSAVAKFLREKGPGFHHIAYRVADIDAVVERMRRLGVPLVDPRPRPGSHNRRTAFLHPDAADGVLIQLIQEPDER
ncbi:MAG: methylmalonyl-CoA epimerase [Deferrisomatales bacterium]